ncbi:NADH-dependent flavin oxidoreductase [Gallibacterium salpingitidis]|uniref:NADH-dependent flavin oxidoreductase n=1 Tax=Gallibacterium salpingitidis TaxID=505341 RepID=A0A1A7NMQ8_9PAST|nr:NADH-dependent flavin oxidoreductase [Gallibacterium salpingitidis]OBW90816.1 NADH-dependent flavin oxidoreductase [Gallibacterium salpingitidis]
MNQPFTFKRKVTIKNKIIMAPMATNMSYFDGIPTKDELEYFSLHSGEVGAVITGATCVQENGKAWPGGLAATSDQHIVGLSKIASAIHKTGTKAILQLFHAGRITKAATIGGEQIVSAGNIPSSIDGAEIPRELTGTEVKKVITAFQKAVIRAIKAGFDGVELHGANNYLIQQFYSPHSNRRQDEWGGNREKRFTFINQLVDAVIQTVETHKPEGFIVGYRFSPEENENPGIGLEDTLYLVDQLANKSLDYLHISLLDYKKMSRDKNYQTKTILEYIHAEIRGRVPLIGIGNIQTEQHITEVLKHSELVAVGRALLIDPHWAAKILNHQEELIDRTLSEYEKEEKIVSNGTWKFLEEMMPERLRYKK